MPENDPIKARLDDQIAWYGRKSSQSRKMFKSLKLLTLVTAAAIPLLASFDTEALRDVALKVTAILGALVVVLEGVQQLNQYQSNWITYRATAESLKHEKFLHLAKAGPYADAESVDRLLAERVEGLVSQEHAKWVSTQSEAVKSKRASQEES